MENYTKPKVAFPVTQQILLWILRFEWKISWQMYVFEVIGS